MIKKHWKCAAVTPYYQETRTQLERCLASVQLQSIKTDHFLVSDGFAQDWLDQTDVRHLRLGKGHADYGNTPRGLGALLAASEQYDAIFFLDADNWLEPEHVALCIDASASSFGTSLDCDIVFSKRIFRRIDGTIMSISEEPNHTDTNCYFFFPGAFHLLSFWITMPKMMSSVGDRVFHALVKSRDLRTAECDRPTVNYHSTWSAHYKALGEDPPIGTKESVQINLKAAFDLMSEREMEIVSRLTGGLVWKR